MAKFFEKLLEKFFDFFNFGRFLTIVIPGLIVALCVAMLVSQVVFPVGGEKPAAESGLKVESSQETSKETVREAGKETVKESSKVITKESGGPEPAAVVPLLLSAAERFQLQLTEDLARVGRNFFPVILLTIIIGMMVYEVAFTLMLYYNSCYRGKDTTPHLYRYSPEHDGESQPNKKFRFLKPAPAPPPVEHQVTSIYFAPFLKEKFSGEENYFGFLTSEYYRFVEFAAVMPLALLLADLLGAGYYLLYAVRNGQLYSPQLWALVFGLPLLVALIFYRWVFPAILRFYRQSRADLVQGVSDFMSKDLEQ